MGDEPIGGDADQRIDEIEGQEIGGDENAETARHREEPRDREAFLRLFFFAQEHGGADDDPQNRGGREQKRARQIEAQAAIISQAEAQVEASQAQLKGSQADAERAALEYGRSLKLEQSNFGSQQRLEQATADRDRTAAALIAAKASVASTAAAVEGAKANLDVLKAQRDEAARQRNELETALARAKRDLSFTRVLAPFDGVVGNKAAEVGNLVQPGTRLMALVPLNASYVDANFKETQLVGIKPGQKVDVAVDALDGKVVEGVVSSISPASGSEFSLLPPDNATGNFTKVVQRVAVRITFPEDVLKEVPLRPGLSVVATVHTRDPDAPKPTLLGALGLEAFATRSVKP